MQRGLGGFKSDAADNFQQKMGESRAVTQPAPPSSPGRTAVWVDSGGRPKSPEANVSDATRRAQEVMRQSQLRRQQGSGAQLRPATPTRGPPSGSQRRAAPGVTRSELMRGGDSPVFAKRDYTSNHPSDE